MAYSLKPGERRLKLLPVTKLKQIKLFKVKDGGFQRTMSKQRALAVADYLRTDPNPQMPAIMVADVGDGNLWSVDGQTRTAGAITAGRPAWVEIVRLRSIDEARQLFIRINSTANRVPSDVLLAASQNPVAASTKALAEQYGALRGHVRRLLTGRHLRLEGSRHCLDQVQRESGLPQP